MHQAPPKKIKITITVKGSQLPTRGRFSLAKKRNILVPIDISLPFQDYRYIYIYNTTLNYVKDGPSSKLMDKVTILLKIRTPLGLTMLWVQPTSY